MKSYSYSKYLISAFIMVACCLQQHCLAQSSTVRPYKFGFRNEEPPAFQHRKEMRDERGIVMGEFGFITADGIYHVTVYATDEQGRFRILAMKSYPYESPPKTVEVMVQPKKTTPKPLTKHNFNTEACSGCFLKNGNNKPKDSSNTGEPKAKHDIMTLSKTLPSAGSVPTLGSSNFPNASPSSTGKTVDLKTGQLHTFSSTYIPKKAIAITTALAPTKSITNSYTNIKDLKYSRNNQNNESPLTTFKAPLDTQALQDFHNTLLHNAPHQYKNKNALSSTTKNEKSLLEYQTQYVKNIMIFMRPNTFNFLQHDLSPLPQKNTLEKTSLNNSPGRNYNTDSLSPRNNNSPEHSSRTKATGSSSTPETTNKQSDAQITQTPPIRTTTTSNKYTKNSAVSKDLNEKNSRPSTQGGSSASVPLSSTATANSPPKTTHKQSDAQITQTQHSITTTTANKDTKNPVISRDLNQKTSRPSTQGGSSVSLPSSSTATENSPPIMEIIMEKVLPALMSKSGQATSTGSTQSTVLNRNSNAAPSAQKPSSSNNGFGGAGKSAGSSGRSAANDDGDLYRFKYILDYHGHTETGKRNGNKEGSYFAIGEDNVERTIEYVANELGYQPRIRWRKLDSNEIKPKENTLKEYEFIWFQK